MHQGDPINSQQPIRVLEILEATTGGTRRHLYYLLKYLDPQKFQFTLVYSNLRDPYFASDLAEFAKSGVTLIEVPMRREIAPWHDLVALIRIYRIMIQGRFDLVHAHSSKAGFLGRLAAKLSGIKAIVYTPHSFAFQYCPQSLQGRLYRFLERTAGYLHHQMICVSEGEREVALRHRITSPAKIQVIPNTVPVEAMQPKRSCAAIKKIFDIPAGVKVVGMVAQFRPQKGYRHFIRAIPLIQKRCPDTRFLIIGDGPLMEEARQSIQQMGIAEAVIMAGHQENPYDFYQVMDVFVLSSLWEGMPYVILEAIAMGLPIVATDTVGNNELVAHGRNGFLVASEASAEIALCVAKIIENQSFRAQFAQESRRIIRKMIDIDDWATQYENCYIDMVHNFKKDPLSKIAESNITRKEARD